MHRHRDAASRRFRGVDAPLREAKRSTSCCVARLIFLRLIFGVGERNCLPVIIARVEFIFPLFFRAPVCKFSTNPKRVVVARLTPRTSHLQGASHLQEEDVSTRHEALGGRDPSRDELRRTCEHVRRSFRRSLDGCLFSDYPQQRRDRRTWGIVAQPARRDDDLFATIATLATTNPLIVIDDKKPQNPRTARSESSNGRTSH